MVLRLLAIVAVMAACTQSFPTLVYEEPQGSLDELNQDVLSNRTPIMMFVNPQDFFSITATRGMGPFPPSDFSKYKDGTIYVYAFRSDYNMQGTVLTSLPSLRNTAYATQNRPSGIVNDSINLPDCLLDGSDYLMGVPTKLVPESSGELLYNYHYEKDEKGQDVLKFGNHVGRDFFYSNVYQEIPYNFFAYYVDDFVPNASNAHREDTHIHYDITIDGTQDIMCGASPDLNTVLTSRYPQQFNRLSTAERNSLRNIGGYCKFAADRDIHPSIDVKHQLAQLKFEAYPADVSTDSLIITGIEVRCRNQADLTVATRDTVNHPLGLKFNDNKADLKLRGDFPERLRSNDGKFSDPGYIIRFDTTDKKWYERKPTQIGENLIVSPDSVYDIVVHAAQIRRINEQGDGGISYIPIVDFKSSKKIRLDTGEMFKPGYVYTIKIAVYGSQKIEVYTAIDNWKPADKPVIIDDDL